MFKSVLADSCIIYHSVGQTPITKKRGKKKNERAKNRFFRNPITTLCNLGRKIAWVSEYILRLYIYSDISIKSIDNALTIFRKFNILLTFYYCSILHASFTKWRINNIHSRHWFNIGCYHVFVVQSSLQKICQMCCTISIASW